MKSELPSEDVNSNGKKGELFEAHVVATGSGVYVGAPFETPTLPGSVGKASRPGCRGPACDCVDLGDIAVEFEPPRMCEVTIEATFSGKHLVGSGGPLAKGEAVVGARVRAQLAGAVQLPQPEAAALCQTASCGPATAPTDGTVTFAVPVVGEAPQLKIDADFSVGQPYWAVNVVALGAAAPQAKGHAQLRAVLPGIAVFAGHDRVLQAVETSQGGVQIE